jgi:hypothetical protein
MNKKATLLVSFSVILILTLVLFASAYAQLGAAKLFEEGQAGRVGSALLQPDGSGDKPYTEGQGAESAGARPGQVSPEGKIEGEAGKTGQAQVENLEFKGPSQDGLTLLLQFSGVTDDGAKGAGTRKEATSILCTNFAPTNSQIEIQIYQWSGAMVYTGTVTAAPNASYTFSTQNTTIYFDDVIFGTGGGTDAIFQGAGQVWTDSNRVICTAEALDPLGYPPEFATSLEMFQE